MTRRAAIVGKVLLAITLSPLFALYGLLVLARGARGLVFRLRGVRRALGGSLSCSNGHVNPTVGRWECGRCKAQYHGWVGRCALCGAGAGWMPCRRCGVGIPFPWARR